jgi:hypothetical protein
VDEHEVALIETTDDIAFLKPFPNRTTPEDPDVGSVPAAFRIKWRSNVNKMFKLKNV